MDAQAESIMKMRADCDHYLRRIDELIVERDEARSNASEWEESAKKVSAMTEETDKLRREKKILEHEVDACEKRMEEAAIQRVVEAEEGTKGKVKLAWEQAFPDNEFLWFEKYLDWADLKTAADQAGRTPPPPVQKESDNDSS